MNYINKIMQFKFFQNFYLEIIKIILYYKYLYIFIKIK